VKSNTTDGQTSCLIFGKHQPFQASILEPLPLADSRLASRGWILQERLLSPRTIHYASAQVVWECCRFYQTEDNIPFPATERPTRVSWLRFPKVGESGLDILWYTNLIGNDFATRNFTQYGDRLVAVAGIAKIFKAAIKQRYVAGLWEDSFIYGLTWETIRHPPLPRNSSTRREPTWSWIAHDFCFNWRRRRSGFVSSKELIINDIRLQYLGHDSDEFGRVDSGSLTATGLTAEFRVARRYQPCWNGTFFADAADEAVREDYISRFDYDYIEENPALAQYHMQDVSIKGLLLGEYNGRGPFFLLLIPNEKGSTRFKRLGTAEAVKGNQKGFLGEVPETLEII